MQLNEWMVLGVIFIAIVIFFVEIGYILITILNAAMYKKQKKKMWQGLGELLSTYYATPDYEMFVFEIENLYKHIVKTNRDLSRQYANISELLEKYLLAIDTKDVELEINDCNKYKRAIYNLRNEYNQKNPLEQIKGTDYLVLKQLLETVDRGDYAECRSIVNKIAVELKGLRDSLTETDKNARKQDFTAKLGIVLSVVFGIMTIIQFFI